MLPMETELKLHFPTVMRYKPNETKFVGIFKTQQNENIFASFNVPNYPEALGITFEAGININETIYQSLISKSDNINFLAFLKHFSQIVTNAPKQKIFNRKMFSRFYHEFRDLKQLNRAEKFIFDDKNETLTILHTDQFNIINEILIKLNFYEEESQMFEVIKHNFPTSKSENLFHKQCSLNVLHKQFLSFVKCLGAFHDAIQKIDSVCWVTAPPKANSQHNYRTIIIGENNMSMKVTFDPWTMSAIPEFKFFGPTNVVKQHKDNLSDNLSNWDTKCDIIQNILKVLDLPFFPVKPAAEGCAENGTNLVLYDSDSECCVCFSYHLNDETPNIRCDNESCRRYFHHECLHEWLSRLPNNIYFGNISGPCPNCEQVSIGQDGQDYAGVQNNMLSMRISSTLIASCTAFP